MYPNGTTILETAIAPAPEIEVRRYVSIQRKAVYLGRYVVGSERDPKALTAREAIEGFSESSKKRMSRYLRNTVSEYKYFCTLTYPFSYPSNGKAVKEHLRRFCRELFRDWRREGLAISSMSAFWFLEFQSRGAPHFHLFLTNAVRITFLARVWYRIVKSDDERHLRAGTQIDRMRAGREGMLAYAKKYAMKGETKVAPPGYENVGRFWGVYGNRDIVAAGLTYGLDDMRNVEFGRQLVAFEKLLDQMVHEERAETYTNEFNGVAFYVKSEKDWLIVQSKFAILMAKSLTNKWGEPVCQDALFFDAETIDATGFL